MLERVPSFIPNLTNNSMSMPPEYWDPRWYAAHTNANHEKRVANQLRTRHVEHFLPTYSSVRRWKDRRVTLERPLFPGYVFVRMTLRDRLQVAQIPGVARLVGFNGPTAILEEEIVALMRGLKSGLSVEPHPYLAVGRRVRIKNGPFAGREGILTRRKNAARLVISLDLIQRLVSVEMDGTNVVRAIGERGQGMRTPIPLLWANRSEVREK